MNVFDKNVILIASMTKAEKRGFKLLYESSNQNKAYMILFDLIVQNITQSFECINDEFNKTTPKNITTASTYLNNLILKYLIYETANKSLKVSLFNQIERAKILFERKLVEESFEELEKTYEQARLYEDEVIQLLILRTQIRFHEKLDFTRISEQELASIHMKQLSLTKKSRIIDQHNFLYNTLRHRINHKGYITTLEKKEAFNDLIISELYLSANDHSVGFEEEKLHFLFQSTYFLETGNHLSAVRNYKQLIELFETNTHLLFNPPIYYLNALKGIVQTLVNAKLYEEIESFLDKIRALDQEAYPTDFRIHTKYFDYTTRLTILLNKGDLTAIGHLNTDFDETLIKNQNSFMPNEQIHIYILQAANCIYQNNFKEARKILSNSITKYKIFQKQPMFKILRLIYLLIKAYNEDISYTSNEILSIQNQSKGEAVSQIETIVLKFAKEYPLPKHKHQQQILWQKYEPKINKALTDKYSQKTLTLFDFTLYIKSQILNIPIQYLLTPI
jgi:hypothetical protein